MDKNIALGIDIGGTTIKGGAITREGKVLDTFSLSVDKNDTQEETANKLIEAIQKFLKEHNYNKDNILGIGLGIPGVIDTTDGTVSYSNNLDWHDLPLGKMIHDATGLPIKTTNDANAATLAEAKFGAGRKYKNLIMLTLGTGVGGGVIVDGKLYEGHLGKGGELGHTVIVVDGEPCTCGRRGCLEAYASATALIRETNKMMEAHKDSKMWQIKEKYGKVSARVAFEAAKENDPYGQALVDYYVKYLGEGLMNFFNVFRPEAVVLSGGIANEREYLTSRLYAYTRDRYFGFRCTPSVDIVTSELGYDSGKIGAAALFFE